MHLSYFQLTVIIIIIIIIITKEQD